MRLCPQPTHLHQQACLHGQQALSESPPALQDRDPWSPQLQELSTAMSVSPLQWDAIHDLALFRDFMLGRWLPTSRFVDSRRQVGKSSRLAQTTTRPKGRFPWKAQQKNISMVRFMHKQSDELRKPLGLLARRD